MLTSNEAQLALKLMNLFFTREEKSNCTPAEGKEILRQDIIVGIRCKYSTNTPGMYGSLTPITFIVLPV